MAHHVGTSGWSYDHWQGVLYPRGASSLARLGAYAERFETVEVNNTFYRWPEPSVFDTWRARVPAGFVFAIKASRGLSQFRKLNDPGPWLDRMTEGLRRLGSQLGVLLVQLPPHFPPNPARLDAFLGQTPSGVRVAVEFRHPGWHTEEVFAILERHGAAYCVMSGANLPCVLRATAMTVYVRLHGPAQHLYGGSYTDDDLRWWADRVREWESQGREVFVYFNNDGFGHAVRNAEALRARLGDPAPATLPSA
jgi:uncharacterized protein YecE (DUF72 family)